MLQKIMKGYYCDVIFVRQTMHEVRPKLHRDDQERIVGFLIRRVLIYFSCLVCIL